MKTETDHGAIALCKGRVVESKCQFRSSRPGTSQAQEICETLDHHHTFDNAHVISKQHDGYFCSIHR